MHKTVELDDGKTILVHELTVGQILDLFEDKDLGGDGSDESGSDISSLMKVATRHLPKATNLTFEEMRDMAPSELKVVYDAFAEVNTVFFGIARSMGMDKMLIELKQAVIEDFSSLLVVSSKRAMSASLTTATPTL
jgi:hypothetical protein